jgi:hypothetical protein
VLNFEKFEGVSQFRPTPPSPEAGYPLVCLEPGQSVTETKVRLITKHIVIEKRVISWGLNPETRFQSSILNKRRGDADNLRNR